MKEKGERASLQSPEPDMPIKRWAIVMVVLLILAFGLMPFSQSLSIFVSLLSLAWGCFYFIAVLMARGSEHAFTVMLLLFLLLAFAVGYLIAPFLN